MSFSTVFSSLKYQNLVEHSSFVASEKYKAEAQFVLIVLTRRVSSRAAAPPSYLSSASNEILIPAAALYANYQPELFVFLEMVALEIPELRSFVNNYFMLISEMLVKV